MLLYLFKKALNAKYIHTNNGVDYALEKEGETIYILFECSDSLGDWAKNFNFVAKPYKKMNQTWRCHKGFADAYSSVKEDIVEYVKEFIFHGKVSNIVCVGYSQGAALALLCMEDMQYCLGGIFNVQGFGFGTPRVIWGTVPKEVKKRLNRFVSVINIDDIVTHSPPKILGYRDVGKVLKIGKKGKYNRFEAHFPESYQEELKEL